MFWPLLFGLMFQSVNLANETFVIPNGVVTPPAILSYSRPSYSEDAWKRGINGVVTFEVEFDRDGGFKILRIVNGLGFGLDESAVDAARTWRFTPALNNGSRVPVIARINVAFKTAFNYAAGSFRFENGTWQEYTGSRRTFSFVEVGRDQTWITMLDGGRNMYIRLPLMGGPSFWSTDSVHWTQLYEVAAEYP
jgi:TonB family protein